MPGCWHGRVLGYGYARVLGCGGAGVWLSQSSGVLSTRVLGG